MNIIVSLSHNVFQMHVFQFTAGGLRLTVFGIRTFIKSINFCESPTFFKAVGVFTPKVRLRGLLYSRLKIHGNARAMWKFLHASLQCEEHLQT